MKDEQLKELLGEMSLKEKVGQLSQITGNFFMEGAALVTGPMQQLHINEEDVKLSGSVLGMIGAEVLIQLQKDYIEKHPHHIPLLFMTDIINGYKTIYPIPLAQGASFMPELSQQCAAMAAKEAAASGLHITFSPMVDLVRDARWGRVMESTGEDVWLNSLFAKAMVEGYQGEEIRSKDKLAACVKHFAGYGAPDGGRDYNTVQLTERTFREYYLPAYKAAIDAGCKMVMASFNTVNDIPATVNKPLLRNILREEMGFWGVLISDYGAMEETICHGLSADREEAARLSIEAGMDIDMMTGIYAENLEGMVKKGQVDEELVDEAVMRVLKLKNEIGLFEHPYKGADVTREKEIILCPEHRELVRKAAESSFVLLKNEEEFFPLKKEEKIAFIGPYVDRKHLLGAWSPMGDIEDTVTVKEAAEEMLEGWDITFSKGCPVMKNVIMAGFNEFHEKGCSEIEEQKLLNAAKIAAEKADKVVLFLGEHYLQTGEAASRGNLDIPEIQQNLLAEVKRVNPNIGIVLFNGRPLVLSGIEKISKAILDVWFPGSEGGRAIVRTLTGACEPTGRLPMSFPYCVGQVPVHYDEFKTGRHYTMEKGKERYVSRYLDIPNAPLYPFGWGMGYTEFTISNIQLSKFEMTKTEKIYASVVVENIGKQKGTEVVQMYVCDVVASVVRPVKQLKGFQRITLDINKKMEVVFEISEDMLRFFTVDGSWKSEPGEFILYIGKNSATDNQTKFWLLE